MKILLVILFSAIILALYTWGIYTIGYLAGLGVGKNGKIL